MASMLNVVVVTDIPSPYQVEFFSSVAKLADLKLRVIYVRRSASVRLWEAIPIQHEHCFLSEAPACEISSWIADCDLAVFNGYRPPEAGRLIALRHRTGKAWAFWGERPGYHFSGWLGFLYRAWALRQLRQSRAPVWGIGKWAVDGYRSELGTGRCFLNVPYYSNLDQFLAIDRRFDRRDPCRFLFSGSFIYRKGLDLVVSAFSRLVSEGRDVELHLLGAGPLERTMRARLSALSPRVCVHGFKQRHELAPAYAEADVLLAPSRYDGWGLVVVEGLAAGMPVISTYNTGAARELIDPENGWIVPAGNEQALLAAMRSAARLDPGHHKAMGQNARLVAATQNHERGAKCFAAAAATTMASFECTNMVPSIEMG
jgi:glycosyltransferase involved in cell wall biosynthesis